MTPPKLPEWPEGLPDECSIEEAIGHYQKGQAAALARMEALAAILRDVRADTGYMVVTGAASEIDELLAACERGKGWTLNSWRTSCRS